MNAEGSVTLWLQRLEAGEQAALQALWERYFTRLVGLARKRLHGSPRQQADEEDVALSALHSFCCGLADGRFPRLADRHDLWQVLVLLTVRKSLKLARHARAGKRGGGRVQHASALEDEEDAGRAFAELLSREPGPDHAAELAEEYGRLLGLLPNDTLRAVAGWKMEGLSNQEIASRLGRSLATVERKLADIRAIWEKPPPG